MNAIKNAKIILETGILEGHALVFGEKLLEVIPEQRLQSYEFDALFDAGENYISPGFIDIHVHGCAGSDTMDATEPALHKISSKLATTGVTAFLATTITEEREKITAALRNISFYKDKVTGAEILGCHLEGPFLSAQFKGAQDSSKMIPPDLSLIRDFKDIIRLVTFAPELPGSEEFIEYCRQNDIILSFGHSAASYEQAIEAISQGVSHMTHTFNGMPRLHHRDPGIVGAAMNSAVTCELIVDNMHLHTAIPEIMLKIKGSDKIVLVTDAIRACGMPEGNYDLGGQQVHVKDGKAALADGGLAGSVLTMNTALKNFVEITGLPLSEAIKAVTTNPASVIGISDRKGRLEPGMDADLTVFDVSFDILYTFVKGKLVYKSNRPC